MNNARKVITNKLKFTNIRLYREGDGLTNEKERLELSRPWDFEVISYTHPSYRYKGRLRLPPDTVI